MRQAGVAPERTEADRVKIFSTAARWPSAPRSNSSLTLLVLSGTLRGDARGIIVGNPTPLTTAGDRAPCFLPPTSEARERAIAGPAPLCRFRRRKTVFSQFG